jgi:hypothetical protein
MKSIKMQGLMKAITVRCLMRVAVDADERCEKWRRRVEGLRQSSKTTQQRRRRWYDARGSGGRNEIWRVSLVRNRASGARAPCFDRVPLSRLHLPCRAYEPIDQRKIDQVHDINTSTT